MKVIPGFSADERPRGTERQVVGDAPVIRLLHAGRGDAEA